eukprot:m.9134 g.9134  ORF g.9134 m.9134 type:complete len:82 (+) comp21108_c0_seq1:1471-1716(+)
MRLESKSGQGTSYSCTETAQQISQPQILQGWTACICHNLIWHLHHFSSLCVKACTGSLPDAPFSSSFSLVCQPNACRPSPT